MARLPQPGSDADQWGTLLNEFLRVAHRENGTLQGTSEVINIRDFGAKPDDATLSVAAANAVAIQNAIDAGYAVFIPASGVFYYNTTLTLRRDSLLFGFGYNSTLVFTGSGVAMQENSGSPNDTNLKLLNFRLTTNVNTSTIAIQLTNSYHSTIEGIAIQGGGDGFTQAGINIVSTSPGNSAAIRIDKCEIQRMEGDGVLISGNNGVGGVYITGCRIQGNNGWGFSSIATGDTQISVENNVIEGNGQGLFQCLQPSTTSIRNNHFESSSPGKTPIVIGLLDHNPNSPGCDASPKYSAALSVIIENNGIHGDGSRYLVYANGAGGHNGFEVKNNSFANAPSSNNSNPETTEAAIRICSGIGISIWNNTITTPDTIKKIYDFSQSVRSVVYDGKQISMVLHGVAQFNDSDFTTVSFESFRDSLYEILLTTDREPGETFQVIDKIEAGFTIQRVNPTSINVIWTVIRRF